MLYELSTNIKTKLFEKGNTRLYLLSRNFVVCRMTFDLREQLSGADVYLFTSSVCENRCHGKTVSATNGGRFHHINKVSCARRSILL